MRLLLFITVYNLIPGITSQGISFKKKKKDTAYTRCLNDCREKLSHMDEIEMWNVCAARCQPLANNPDYVLPPMEDYHQGAVVPAHISSTDMRVYMAPNMRAKAGLLAQNVIHNHQHVTIHHHHYHYPEEEK